MRSCCCSSRKGEAEVAGNGSKCLLSNGMSSRGRSMRRSTKHARIPYFPLAETLRHARLDILWEEPDPRGNSLVLDYQELVLDAPPQLVKRDDSLAECLQGHDVPRRLRFAGLTLLKRKGLYATLDLLPPDHAARSLQGMLHWYPPEKTEPLYILMNASTELADL